MLLTLQSSANTVTAPCVACSDVQYICQPLHSTIIWNVFAWGNHIILPDNLCAFNLQRHMYSRANNIDMFGISSYQCKIIPYYAPITFEITADSNNVIREEPILEADIFFWPAKCIFQSSTVWGSLHIELPRPWTQLGSALSPLSKLPGENLRLWVMQRIQGDNPTNHEVIKNLLEEYQQTREPSTHSTFLSVVLILAVCGKPTYMPAMHHHYAWHNLLAQIIVCTQSAMIGIPAYIELIYT